MSKRRPRLIHKKSAALSGVGNKEFYGWCASWWRPVLASPWRDLGKVGERLMPAFLFFMEETTLQTMSRLLQRSTPFAKTDSSRARIFTFRRLHKKGRLPSFRQFLVRRVSHE